MIQSALRALTQEQLDAYQANGYHIARGMFSAGEVAHLIAVFMDAMKDGPVPGLNEMDRITDPSDPLSRYPRMLQPHKDAPDPKLRDVSMKYLLDARIGAVLTDLLGEEPLAAQSMVYFKPPGARGQDFHQDNFYLKIRPGTCMAAWVALDPADEENGGLSVVPGSHKMELVCPEHGSDRKNFFGGHHIDTPDGMELVPTRLNAGDCLFFNGSVIHGSYPNVSKDRFRRSFICHYAPQSCTQAAEYYKLYRFDGTRVDRELAVGGGPCGEARDAAK